LIPECFQSTGLNLPRLTKRIVDAAKPRQKDYFVWCSATPGFGLRIYHSGKKVFVSQVRVGRCTRRVKIGSYGLYTVEQARRRAEEVGRLAAEGRDPQREKIEARRALSVSAMCDEYLKAAKAGLVLTRFRRPKRSAALAIDEGRISRHIKPLIGKLPANDVTRAEVQRMADAIARGVTAGCFFTKPRGKAVVRGGPGAAARVVELLGGIYSWAEKRALATGPSPVRGVETARGNAKDRFLEAWELAQLGKAMAAKKNSLPNAVAALRLIALTGLRREEACRLRWVEVDVKAKCLRLEGSKTGRSVRPIGSAALALLLSIPQRSDIWVFPNQNDTGSADLKKPIALIFDLAGLKDARSHDLRRTFASVAADEGFGDATIGELLGHARRGVTARHYIRRPDAALVAAADIVSARIAASLDSFGSPAKVIRFDGRHESKA
jgi:integrase